MSILLDSEGEGAMASREAAPGSVRANLLTQKMAHASAASGSASQVIEASVSKKPVGKKSTDKKRSPPANEKEINGDGEGPPLKKSKGDEGVRQKMVDTEGIPLPGDLFAFQDNQLMHRLLRVNVLSHEYDKSRDLTSAERRATLDRLCCRVHCLEVAEHDSVELEVPRLKEKLADATKAKAELEKAKASAEKSPTEVELMRANLAKYLERLKSENSDILMDSQATTGERDRLAEAVKQADLERQGLIDARIVDETNVEVKDAYIRHLAFVLEPQLGLLPVEVADEIRGLPTVFDVEVVPQKYEQPKGVGEGVVAKGIEESLVA